MTSLRLVHVHTHTPIHTPFCTGEPVGRHEHIREALGYHSDRGYSDQCDTQNPSVRL